MADGKLEPTTLLGGEGVRFDLGNGTKHAQGEHAGFAWSYQSGPGGWYWSIRGWGQEGGCGVGSTRAETEELARHLIETKFQAWRDQLREFLK